MKGYTLFELVIVLGIFVILLLASFFGITTLQTESDLDADANNIVRILEFARNKTVASEGAIQYGLHIATSTTPHQYTLFQGSDYASRTISEDKIYELHEGVEFGSVSFASGTEVVFDRIEGSIEQSGNIILQIESDPSRARTVSIENSGVIAIDEGISPGDEDRIKDSRHVHIDYSGRFIDTTTESIVLDFGTATETIVLADNLDGGQLAWEGTVEVDGEDQTLRIYTHLLNDNGVDSQFSVHRDRRFNTKAVTITISADATGKVIEYDAAGNIISGGESIYVTATETE